MSIERPECAGWHEAEPVCDGDEAEAPCAYRERCLLLLSFAGGKGVRTPELISKVNSEWDEARLDAHIEARDAKLQVLKDREHQLALEQAERERKEAERKKKAEELRAQRQAERQEAGREAHGEGIPLELPVGPLGATTAPALLRAGVMPIPGFGSRVKKQKKAKDIAPRPSPRYDHSLPLVDAFLELLATELGRKVLEEGEQSMRVGDFFLRYTRSMGGRAIGVYEATARNSATHRRIAKIVLQVTAATMNMQVNCSDYIQALRHRPPPAVQTRTWTDMKPMVTMTGIDAHSARDCARFVARLYNAGLIEGEV